METKKSHLRLALEQGIIAGAITILMALMGMVEAFKDRAILGTFLSMGETLVIAGIFMMAYSTARKAGGNRSQAIQMGIITGTVAGLCLALFVLIGTWIDMRAVLVNASPALYQVLTFGLPTYAGAAMLVVMGAVLGALAVGLDLLPKNYRSATMATIITVILVGLMAELLKIVFGQWPMVSRATSWAFSGKGLSYPGGLAVAVLIMGLNLWSSRQAAIKPRKPFTDPSLWRGRQGYIRIAVLAAVLLLMPLVFGVYISEVMDQVGLFILMGLGLNIVVGYAGLLDLGYVAFYAIGAYVVGFLTSPEIAPRFIGTTLTWWQALIPAVLVSTLSGVLLGIPVLRMRGDYLAIVTLGFGEIIRIVALSDMLKPFIGGSQGIQQIAKPTIGSFVFRDQQSIYYIILAGMILAGFIAIRLRDSRLGRSWMAMREDEDVAEAMGIHLITTKLLAFATGAAFSGLSGAIFAAKIGSIYPHSFHLMISINVLSLIIVGGLGSIPGVIVGSLALVGMPELLREFADFRLLVYGALLVWMMLNRPEGLWPEEAHRRELHEAEAEPVESAA